MYVFFYSGKIHVKLLTILMTLNSFYLAIQNTIADGLLINQVRKDSKYGASDL